MKLFLDEAVQHRLANLLAEDGHDAAHVRLAGMQGAADEEVMAFAPWRGSRTRSCPVPRPTASGCDRSRLSTLGDRLHNWRSHRPQGFENRRRVSVGRAGSNLRPTDYES